MEKNIIFKGTATAMVTPFRNGEIDFRQFGMLLDRQTDNGIDALVICGTTGEAATMTDCERVRVIDFAVRRSGVKVPIIAGTGSNCTDHAIELTKAAAEIGCDAALVVTPYYNKATQMGLVKHFTAIADASDIPLILYNVPTRTGVNIEPQTYAALADHPNIAAIKESGSNIVKIAETVRLCGDKLALYSGNDNQILPLLAFGGLGVISVLSNLLPVSVNEICKRYFDGDAEGALAKQLELLPLMEEIFIEVNPIPIKAAMSSRSLCSDEVRLPLTPLEDKNRAKLFSLVEKYANL